MWVLLQVPTVSKYLSFREATRTNVTTCPDNAAQLTPEQTCLILRFGREYFDPLRIKAGTPLYVSSMFRSACVNAHVGGATNSEHLLRNNIAAVDIDQDGKRNVKTNKEVFYLIKDSTEYRKLIWEFGTPPEGSGPAWVHVSWSPDPKLNIKKTYRAVRRGNKTEYLIF